MPVRSRWARSRPRSGEPVCTAATRPYSVSLATATASASSRTTTTGPRTPDGDMAGTQLGALAAFEVSGTPQVVRRTPGAVKRMPIDLLKICVQVRGHATVFQGDRHVALEPGQMAIYDTGRPYHLRLDQQ